MGKYRVILADPPWQYNNNGSSGAAENHYSTMSAAEMFSLPVNYWAADDCLLLCWATFPLLPTAIALVDAWGFEYKTAIPWIKVNKILGVDMFTNHLVFWPSWGNGWWARGNAELLLVGVRGDVPKLSDPPLSLIDDRGDGRPILIGPRLEHSRKLSSAHEYAEKFPGPRLEMFARRGRDGWDLWGNEAPGAVNLAAAGGSDA